MSVIQKQPFIEKVIATLSDEEKVALVSLINGNDLEPSFKSLVNKTYNISVSDKGVSHIILETIERTYTGYLLYTDSYCVLVSYKNIQELVMLNINPTKNTSEVVKEQLTITELRFELADAGGIGTDVSVDEINSGNATAGQVMTANGSGGASWQDNSVEGNPEVPAGTTPIELEGLKVGNTYFKTASIPTVSIALSQVVSADPIVQVQLTNDQYNIFANNKQVIIDMSALDPTLPIVVWQYAQEDSDEIGFGFADSSSTNYYYQIVIDKSTKVALYQTNEKWVSAVRIVAPDVSYDEGKLLSFDDAGEGIATRNLPILTTAPSSDNSEGGLIIVVLSSEPQQRYSGYLYVITA